MPSGNARACANARAVGMGAMDTHSRTNSPTPFTANRPIVAYSLRKRSGCTPTYPDRPKRLKTPKNALHVKLVDDRFQDLRNGPRFSQLIPVFRANRHCIFSRDH